MCLAISWIMSTEQFASVRMIEFHTDARRCVAMSRGIDQVDALQFLMENVLKLDKKKHLVGFVIVWSPTARVLPDITLLPHVGDGEVGGDLVSAHRGRRSLFQMFRP